MPREHEESKLARQKCGKRKGPCCGSEEEERSQRGKSSVKGTNNLFTERKTSTIHQSASRGGGETRESSEGGGREERMKCTEEGVGNRGWTTQLAAECCY